MLHEIEFDIFAIMRWNSFEGQKAIETLLMGMQNFSRVKRLFSDNKSDHASVKVGQSNSV